MTPVIQIDALALVLSSKRLVMKNFYLTNNKLISIMTYGKEGRYGDFNIKVYTRLYKSLSSLEWYKFTD